MKKIILISLLVFISNFAFAQNYILKSSLDNSVVEYAHIAFLGVKDGTYSNEKGEFTIPNNVDSIYISHISFENKLVSRKDFDKIIFLIASENQLASIEVKSKKKPKPYKIPKKSSRMGLNMPSCEIGTTFIEKNQEKDSYLTTITVPVMKGTGSPILRINLYKMDATNLPDSLIWSVLVEEDDYYEDEIFLSDLYIKLEKQQEYFISLELLGYKDKDAEDFVRYEKYEDMLRHWYMLNKNETCFTTHKNRQEGWFAQSIKAPSLLDRVPIFFLEIE